MSDSLSCPAWLHSGMFALVLMLLGGCQAELDAQGLREVDTVDYVVSDSTTPPAADAGWRPYQLPHGIRWPQPEQSDLVYWFRFSLDRPSTTALQGLYFYRYSESLDLYFNGAYIGGDTHRRGFDTSAWNHPLLIPIQQATWREGSNEVLIRFESSRLGGVFASFLFGDYRQLQALWDARHFRQITINQWLLSLGVVATLLSFLLWLSRREERLSLQFAAMSCCWLIVTLHLVLYYVPVSDRWWLPLVHVAIDAWVYCLCLFMSSWFGLERPKLLYWLRWLLAGACVWHALALLPGWWMGAYAFHTAGLLCVLALQYQGLVQMRRQSRRKVQALTLIVVLQAVCYGHDLYALIYAPLPTWQTSFHWSQFVFPLLQGVFLVSLLRRFAQALRVAESLNQVLEARVTASRAQLEVAYARSHQVELQRVAEEERLRIYRDLHDDVGSKLLSIAHASRDTRVGGLASSALESLRDAVARANNPELPFRSFLDALHEEMQLRLQGLGIRLDWGQPDSDLDWIVDSEQNYHLSRIFRELVNNIIRHAGASAVEFSVAKVGDRWQFRLADNGRGFKDAGGVAKGGNGLHHIRERAQALGAETQWSSRPGTGLLFTLVLQAP